MTAVTYEEYKAEYGTPPVTEAEFGRLAQRALVAVRNLCFGREDRDETAARKAMKEILAFWISRGGEAGMTEDRLTAGETVGNYSVSYKKKEGDLSCFGLCISPTALMILTDAGLRDPAV